MLNKDFRYISQVEQEEHDDTANVELKKVGTYGWNSDDLEWKRLSVDTNGELNISVTGDGLAAESTLLSVEAELGEIKNTVATDSTSVTISDTLGRMEAALTGQTAVALAYDVDGNLETLTKDVGGTTYVKTLSYTDGVLTNVSEWVAQ